MNREAREILARYGIRLDVTRPLRSVGLGAQQMVALARAVSPTDAAAAKVLIMDEPTSSLEPREVETLFRVVRDLSAQGIAIVYVSHRLDELYELCDRVTVLRDGRVVHSGHLKDLERLALVAHMLGRDLAEVRREGLTQFSDDRASGAATAAEPLLRAEGL